jgi:hypothetical protein
VKQGIYLGPPRPKLPGIIRGLGLAMAAAAVLLGVFVVRDRREVAELRRDVERLTEEVSSAPAAAGVHPGVASSLETVLVSGLLDTVAPTDALRLLSSSLPEGMTLVNASLDASPPNRTLTLEATAASAGEVTELERRMSASPMVSGTTLLEERRLPGGALSVRLEVNLLRGGAP